MRNGIRSESLKENALWLQHLAGLARGDSALSFSFLLDENKKRIDEIKEVLEDSYIVKYNTNLELVTIRHYDQKTIDLVVKDKEILMEQRTRTTARFVLSSQ